MFKKPATLLFALLPVATSPADLSRETRSAYLQTRPVAVTYGGTHAASDAVIFSRSDDCYVQAVSGFTGERLWAVHPKELAPDPAVQPADPGATCLHPGTAGDIVPVIADHDRDGTVETEDGDFVHRVFATRESGHSVFSLDVSDRLNPTLNWRFASSSAGHRWSRPTIARIDAGPANFSARNVEGAVVIVAGGDETVHEKDDGTLSHPAASDVPGTGIYMLDLHSGAVIWRAGPDDAADLTLDSRVGQEAPLSLPNPIRVVDMNSDGFADRMYASDRDGQILRFDIFQGREPDGIGADAMVTGGVIARLNAVASASPAAPNARRFVASPDVSVFADARAARRFVAISIGSGDRSRLSDTVPTDRFYSIRDPDVFNQLAQAEYDDYPIVTESDLVDVSGALGNTIPLKQRGWMLTLPKNHKVLSSSVTFDNAIYFVAFAPETDAEPARTAAQGRNILYRVNVVNGDPAVARPDRETPGSGDLLRLRELHQGGIAPTPRFLFPNREATDCAGSECAPHVLACVGVECFEPGFTNRPVRTVWTREGMQ